MADSLEFFFDISSPWTYLAFERVQPVAARHGIEITWRPFLVGGVFNAVNPSVYENRQRPVPLKARYYRKDLADWARYVGIEIGSPPVFPVNSVKVMRGAFIAIEQDRLVPYARAFFQRYWGALADISQDEVIREVVSELGFDVAEFFERITSQALKDQLRANTEELIERGGFGSPTVFVDQADMYFGNDRMELIDDRLRR